MTARTPKGGSRSRGEWTLRPSVLAPLQKSGPAFASLTSVPSFAVARRQSSFARRRPSGVVRLAPCGSLRSLLAPLSTSAASLATGYALRSRPSGASAAFATLRPRRLSSGQAPRFAMSFLRTPLGVPSARLPRILLRSGRSGCGFAPLPSARIHALSGRSALWPRRLALSTPRKDLGSQIATLAGFYASLSLRYILLLCAFSPYLRSVLFGTIFFFNLDKN